MKFQLILLCLFISTSYLLAQTCNSGEFLNSKSVCTLCTSVTANCLSCFDGNGTCEICKGFIPAVNGVCSCSAGTIQVFNSTTQTFQCVTPQVAQSYWTNYSTQISQMTENLTIQDYYILEAAAFGVNGASTYVCPALEAIGTVLDYGIAEMYTQEKQLHALAAAGVLVALAYNSQLCFDSMYSAIFSANNLARFNYTTLKIMSLIGEFHGIMIAKINTFNFTGYDIRQARQMITEADISLDNWKNLMLAYVADSGYLKTYHFSNIYIKFAGLTRDSFSSGLLTNNYVVWASSTALNLIPANQSIYFVQGVYTSNPLSGYSQITRNIVSNVETLQFYYSSKYLSANQYITGLTGSSMQFMVQMNQTYNVVLDQWAASSINWYMNSDQCVWTNLTATCNITTLAGSDIYALVENQGEDQ